MSLLDTPPLIIETTVSSTTMLAPETSTEPTSTTISRKDEQVVVVVVTHEETNASSIPITDNCAKLSPIQTEETGEDIIASEATSVTPENQNRLYSAGDSLFDDHHSTSTVGAKNTTTSLPSSVNDNNNIIINKNNTSQESIDHHTNNLTHKNLIKSKPQTILTKGRVVSLDRIDYSHIQQPSKSLHNRITTTTTTDSEYSDDDIEDNEMSSSTYSSDGEGSYFSEHLPSPKSASVSRYMIHPTHSNNNHNTTNNNSIRSYEKSHSAGPLLPLPKRPELHKAYSTGMANLQIPRLKVSDCIPSNNYAPPESDLSLSSSDDDEGDCCSLSSNVENRALTSSSFSQHPRPSSTTSSSSLPPYSHFKNRPPIPSSNREPFTDLSKASSSGVSSSFPSIRTDESDGNSVPVGRHRRTASIGSTSSYSTTKSKHSRKSSSIFRNVEGDANHTSGISSGNSVQEQQSLSGSETSTSRKKILLTSEQKKHWASNGVVTKDQTMDGDSVSTKEKSDHVFSTLMYSSDESSRHCHIEVSSSKEETTKVITTRQESENANYLNNDLSHPLGLSSGPHNLESNKSLSYRNVNNGPPPNQSQEKDIRPTSTQPTTSSTRDYRDFPPSDADISSSLSPRTYRIYFRRWIMLAYMSILNLLSDWTCYSVAPMSILMSQAFEDINPESLVTLFLAGNVVSTLLEPFMVNHFGLRKTVVFGSFLLMIGSVVKSGGIPGIIGTNLGEDVGEWRIYAGFGIVGLSQPLYQCTPALLSCAWFPDKERTLATGIALNSNQLGIGMAFLVGTILVAKAEDIPRYFGILTLISTVTFIGCFFQFDDAPPSPPSETAFLMRMKSSPFIRSVSHMIPTRRTYSSLDEETGVSSVRSVSSIGSGISKNLKSSRMGNLSGYERSSRKDVSLNGFHTNETPPPNLFISSRKSPRVKGKRHTRKSGKNGSLSSGSSRHRRSKDLHPNFAPSFVGGVESTSDAKDKINLFEREAQGYGSIIPPSTMMSGYGFYGGYPRPYPHHPESYFVTPQRDNKYRPEASSARHSIMRENSANSNSSKGYGVNSSFTDIESVPETPFPNLRYVPTPPTSHASAYNSNYMPYTYSDVPRMMYPQPHEYRNYYSYPVPPPPPPDYCSYVMADPYFRNYYGAQLPIYPVPYPINFDRHNNDSMKEESTIMSMKNCFSRRGFTHSVVAFTASGIVINTLSTYMDYLLSLGGSGRNIVGLVGFFFQVLIMASSMIFGKLTDRYRAYYAVIILLLVAGAFALAECGVNLDANRGGDLKWSLLFAAVMIGPLQPVATELGVEVAHPLSGNTVLVLQQLFSNLFSASFVPIFKVMRDYGQHAENGFERPQYTFSFYLLIVIHAIATVYFATFNGHYLRYAQETAKKQEIVGDMNGNNSTSHVSHSNAVSRNPMNGHNSCHNHETQTLLTT